MDYPIIPERPSMLLPPFFLHHKYLFHTVKVNALSNSAGLGQPELQFWWVPQNWTIKRIQNIKLHIFVMMHHFLKLNHIQCSQCTKKCLAKSLFTKIYFYVLLCWFLITDINSCKILDSSLQIESRHGITCIKNPTMHIPKYLTWFYEFNIFMTWEQCCKLYKVIQY